MAKERVNVGIIGAGSIAWTHANGYTAVPETMIAAFVDVMEERAAKLAESFGVKAWYKDYREVLKRRDIQVISICTPPHLHARMAVEAAEAGKHFLVEKPMAINLKEADKMVRAAKKSGVTAAVALQHRYKPDSEKIQGLLKEGYLGKLVQVKLRSFHQFVRRPELAGHWYFKPEISGGGLLLQEGVHYIDLVSWLVGGEAKSVHARLTTISEGLPADVDDNALVICEYEGGVQALFDLSWTNRSFARVPYMELYGTEGDIIYTRDESTKKIDLCTEKARLPKGHEESWTFQINSAYYQQPHTHLIQDFVKSIIQGRAMGKLPTIEYGRGVQEIMEAACESNSKKATMQLPLT